ncbi:uncharacterized protein LOC144023974 isoform X2 [Festucalex cinctus]
MVLFLKLLLLSLTFHKFRADVDRFSCPKGKLIKMHGASPYCEACPEGYHQPGKNYSKQCKACTKCDEESGSKVTEKCTKVADTKCECRKGFDPAESDFATCECRVGSGLHDGECSKCEDGSFNQRPNGPCIQWKECKSGVNVSGSSTSDIICNEDVNHHPHSSPTSNHTVSVITPKREWDQSHDDAHLETTATARYDVPSRDNVQPAPPSNATGHHISMAFVIFGIVALVVLSVVASKVRSTTCVRRRPAEQTDSLCRRPVEESGDDIRSNLNPKEP